jgi:uncharacterized cupredoxin-like copper-binding protein
MKYHPRALLLAAAVLAAAVGTVHAHGKKDHAAKPAALKKEQKAWGIAGDPKAVTRTIEVTMTDAMRFSPDRIELEQGETVRFVHKNAGAVMHEFVLGTKKELDEHAALMQKFPDMEHDEPHMAHVGPGKRGEIVWTFNRPGEFDFACLIPGHYQAGMIGKIEVADAAPSQSASAAVAMIDGEVRKVDKDNGKVTLKHGEIKNLDMPGMTMVFKVKEPAMLEQLQPGDKVRFRADKVDGGFVITAIEAVKQ